MIPTSLLLLLAKATLVLVAALAIARLLQRAPAGARHVVWLVTLGGLLLVPALALWAPLRLAVLPAEAVAPIVAPLPAAAPSVALPATTPTPASPVAAPALPSTDATTTSLVRRVLGVVPALLRMSDVDLSDAEIARLRDSIRRARDDGR